MNQLNHIIYDNYNHINKINPQNPNSLTAFCDGSAIHNGNINCKASYACIFPHNDSWSICYEIKNGKKSNNRAEYLAALEAIKRANIENPDMSQPLFIFSDSMLLINSMTKWINNWILKNWKKSNGSPVENKDILHLLVKTSGSRLIIWKHVKAHTNKNNWESFWNNKVDIMAKQKIKPTKGL